MTARAPFTEAALRRAIRAAERCGYQVGGVRPDGAVLVYKDNRPENLSIVPPAAQNEPANSWEDV